ncbi:glucosamine-6-phosphate deaminase [Bacillus sp. T33-2]|uniref:glucosamine-6-phosphate deaminase n=1 Tax=Bacillus sp. T33-2 TaxID=2054168 RepID=UPI000C77D6F9|nr:glucosamine-6-phosphate deaminase [Bacillus sp. T33-2]PLR99110.1 glucosamine-6-phosphate deaminase [Bacillus sp. T33-2]
MKTIRTADYGEMSRMAAAEMIKRIKSNPGLKLGLATGSTPKGVYRELINDHQQNGTSYKQIQTFNLDEYIGIGKKDPNSYHFFMCQQLFDHIDIPLDQTYIPDGTVENLDAECDRYEKFIKDHGAIDLQLLGLGHNGHIGFNEPGTPFSSRTHIVELADSTRKANSRFFASIEEVPTHAITMGIATIMDSKEIFLVVSGEAKADALARLINGPVDEQFPASALKNHGNVTIFADEAALKYINGA